MMAYISLSKTAGQSSHSWKYPLRLLICFCTGFTCSHGPDEVRATIDLSFLMADMVHA